jgi:hypothetical protein
MHKRGVAFTVVVALLGVYGCPLRGDPLGDLTELHGSAERDFAAKPEAWDKASVGESFRAGDALRTSRASDAYVRLARGGALKLGPESLVRFRGAPGSQRSLDIASGDAEIESGSDPLVFHTHLGRASIEAGGRLRVNSSDERTQFEVLVGQTVIEGDGGSSMRLDPGEKISFDFGGAILDHTGKTANPAPPDEPVAKEEAADAGILGMTITVSVKGSGVKVQHDGKTWAPLPPGDAEMTAGSRVRLPKGTSLDVSRGGERASVRGAGEVVVGTDTGALLDTEEGDVAVDASAAVVRIAVPGGVIMARRGAKAAVSVRRGRPTDVASLRGEVEVESKKARALLAAGQSTKLARGGEIETEDVTVTNADFSIQAGESPVVHDPHAPTAVRILFSNLCQGEGEIEFMGSATRRKWAHARGTGSAVMLAGPGKNRYRVKCIDDDGVGDTKVEGAIAIAKDSGTAQLPRRAPHNTIDADGRKYTVLYQNLLPQLTVEWSTAPTAESFILHVEPEHGDPRLVDARTASIKFPSGRLAEGVYGLWFEIPGDLSHRSPKTTLRIDFDNAAPAANIQEPPAGTPVSGTTTVAGVAQDGAKVSVSGVELPLDAQFRFRDEGSAKPGESSLAIRIAHPKHGVHYYLRRLQKGEP